MKKLIRVVMLVIFLTSIQPLTISGQNAPTLSKAVNSQSADFQVGTVQYILLHKDQIPRKKWYTVPTTGEKIWFNGSNLFFGRNLTSADIAGLRKLRGRDTKPGRIHNSGYTSFGERTPLSQGFIEIDPDAWYFCLEDGTPVFKGNCLNELYFEAAYIAPKKEEPVKPLLIQKDMMSVPCFNVSVSMKPFDAEWGGRWSESGQFFLKDGTWYEKVGGTSESMDVKEITCTPAVNTYIPQRQVQVAAVQYLMPAAEYYSPPRQQQQQVNNNYNSGNRTFVLAPSFSFNGNTWGNTWGQSPQQPVYHQPPYVDYWQGGRPFDGTPINTTGGAPFGGGSTTYYDPYYPSGGMSFGGGGLPFVNQLVP